MQDAAPVTKSCLNVALRNPRQGNPRLEEPQTLQSVGQSRTVSDSYAAGPTTDCGTNGVAAGGRKSHHNQRGLRREVPVFLGPCFTQLEERREAKKEDLSAVLVSALTWESNRARPKKRVGESKRDPGG